MISPSADPAAAIRAAVDTYSRDQDVPALLERLAATTQGATPEQLAEAVEPFRDIPEVAGPVYEHIVAQRPDDARAMVILANAYWLTGRGPEVVGALAERAMAADPANRGAWHLWALTEANPRARTERWRQVTQRFPEDDLARAAFADNATSLAGAENDPVALKLAIEAYETLLRRSQHAEQRRAIEGALTTLRGWRL